MLMRIKKELCRLKSENPELSKFVRRNMCLDNTARSKNNEQSAESSIDNTDNLNYGIRSYIFLIEFRDIKDSLILFEKVHRFRLNSGLKILMKCQSYLILIHFNNSIFAKNYNQEIRSLGEIILQGVLMRLSCFDSSKTISKRIIIK